MTKLSTWWQNERPRLLGITVAVLALLAAFGLTFSHDEAAAIVALVGVLVGPAAGELGRAGVVPTGRANAHRYAPLPPADAPLPAPRGRRRGLLPSWPDHRDLAATHFINQAATAIPKTLNLAKGLTLNILGNDRIGDCFWAALLHGMQCAYSAAGHPFTPTLDMAVAGYKTTGYDPSRTDAQGNNPTDNGTEPRAGLKSAVKLGWIKAFARVQTDDASIRQAIVAYRGAVILCWALPADVPENGDWTKVSGPQADGHATQPYGYTAARISNDTWAEHGYYSKPFAGAYLIDAWAFTLPDPSVQPLIDHEALAGALAKLQHDRDATVPA